MPEETMALMREIQELNARMQELQQLITEKTNILNRYLSGGAAAEPQAVPPAETENPSQAVFCAVKFAKGDTVYTYKTTIRDLAVGDMVAVPQNGGIAMAVVVGVDTKEVGVFPGNLVVSLREFDLNPAELTPKMREDYQAIKARMKNPSFFRIGIPAKAEATDTLAVSVRFLDGNNMQEYTYLTDVDTYRSGEVVVVPTGPFNLAKRASIIKYVPYPKDDGIDYKKVFCHVRDYERMLDGMGNG